MKFLKTFVMVLVLSYIFVFCGGWMLFDFGQRPFVAVAACAFVAAVVASVFAYQERRIDGLEERIKALEERKSE